MVELYLQIAPVVFVAEMFASAWAVGWVLTYDRHY